MSSQKIYLKVGDIFWNRDKTSIAHVIYLTKDKMRIQWFSIGNNVTMEYSTNNIPQLYKFWRKAGYLLPCHLM